MTGVDPGASVALIQGAPCPGPCGVDASCQPSVVESSQSLGWSADEQGRVACLLRVRLRQDARVYHVLRSPRADDLAPGCRVGLSREVAAPG